MGCGRLFEGTPTQMWTSLKYMLDNFDEETSIYCAHEYSVANAQFAYALEGADNEDLVQRVADVMAKRGQKLPTVPFLFGVEKKTSPFLRVREVAPHVATVWRSETDSKEVFRRVRELRNNFVFEKDWTPPAGGAVLGAVAAAGGNKRPVTNGVLDGGPNRKRSRSGSPRGR